MPETVGKMPDTSGNCADFIRRFHFFNRLLTYLHVLLLSWITLHVSGLRMSLGEVSALRLVSSCLAHGEREIVQEKQKQDDGRSEIVFHERVP